MPKTHLPLSRPCYLGTKPDDDPSLIYKTLIPQSQTFSNQTSKVFFSIVSSFVCFEYLIVKVFRLTDFAALCQLHTHTKTFLFKTVFAFIYTKPSYLVHSALKLEKKVQFQKYKDRFFCYFKNGKKSIFAPEKSLKPPKMQF